MWTYDTTNERWIDPNTGGKLESPPVLFFANLSTEQIQFKTFDGTDYADDTQFASAISFEFSLDNDWIHKLEGALTTGYSGAVTSIQISGITTAPPETGEIILENAAGETETIAYTAVADNGSNIYTFTVSVTLTYVYVLGDDADVKEEVILRIENSDIDSSSKATGLFTLTCDALTRGGMLATKKNPEASDVKCEWKAYNGTPRIIKTLQEDFRFRNLLDYEGIVAPVTPGNYYTKAESDARYIGNYQEVSTTSTLTLPNWMNVVYLTGTITVTLPIPTSYMEIYLITKDANVQTINPNGKTINGVSGNQTLTPQYNGYHLIWDGSNWINPNQSIV